MSEEVYEPNDLLTLYPNHVIVEVETLGGVRHVGEVEITLEHDHRLFAGRGRILEAGTAARGALALSVQRFNLPGFQEVIYEPKSDALVLPPEFSTGGLPVVLVAVADVLAIVNRKEAA